MTAPRTRQTPTHRPGDPPVEPEPQVPLRPGSPGERLLASLPVETSLSLRRAGHATGMGDLYVLDGVRALERAGLVVTRRDLGSAATSLHGLVTLTAAGRAAQRALGKPGT